MRRFLINRRYDITGISGIGTIAEGVEFIPGGYAILYWKRTGTWGWYPTVESQKEGNSIEEIHCYPVINGQPNAEIIWIDKEEEEENI
jgi:hypothetical protein